MKPGVGKLFPMTMGLAICLLAGCNGGGGSKTTGPTKDTAMTMIERDHEVKIAVHPFNYPFEFGSGTGVQGIGADIAEAIAKSLGYKVNWMKAESFDQVFAMVEKGEAQMAISSISITEERKKKFLFSQPYFMDSGQVITIRSSDKTIAKLADLAGKRVGVQENTTGQRFLESQKLPGIQISPVSTLDDALLKLSAGELDAVVGDKPILALTIFNTEGYRTRLKTVGDLLTQEPYGVMTTSPAMLKAANETIARLDQEGKLKEIIKHRFDDYNSWIEKKIADETKKLREAKAPKTVLFRLSTKKFPIDRLDGHQIHLSGGGRSFTSSHITTSGSSGSCSVAGVPPGKYTAHLALLKFTTNIEIPEDSTKSVTINLNF